MLGLRPDPIYFELLESQGSAILRSAEILRMLSLDASRIDMYVAQIDQAANDSAEASVHLLIKVSSSFITPLDKEDLCKLTRSLDAIVDQASDIAKMIRELGITKPCEEFQSITDILVEIGGYLKEAVGIIRNRSRNHEMLEELRRVRRLKPEVTLLCFKMINSMIDNRDLNNKQRLKWGLLLEQVEGYLEKIISSTNIIELISIKYA